MSTTIVLLSGGITEYPIPAGSPAVGNGLIGITAGPDGNVYFTDTLNNAIGQITPSGVITELPLPSSNDGSLVKNGLDGITLGANNELVFTEATGGRSLHRGHEQQRDSGGLLRRRATSRPSPAAAKLVTAAMAGPRPTPS